MFNTIDELKAFKPDSDGHIIAYALNMWANHIETHNLSVSAQDAINMKQQDIIQPLTLEQQKFVIRLRDLALKEMWRKKEHKRNEEAGTD